MPSKVPNFIEGVYRDYQRYAKECGTPINVSVLIAQACLESDYGQSTLAREANNYGGIKASPPWVGEPYYKYSLEDDGKGNLSNERSGFARFSNVEEFIKYHCNFCQNNDYRKNYYAKVLNADNYKDQCKGLQGTYATDTTYAGKLINIIEKNNLTKYDIIPSGNREDKTENEEVLNSMKMYEFKQKITRVNIGGPLGKVEYLVFHFVGAAGQALANANYFYNTNRNASAHLFIDKNEIYQVVPFNRVAWHVGKIA